MWGQKLFQPGKLVATPGVVAAVAQIPDVELVEVAVACLVRHVFGDWGDVPPEDQAANDHAAITGGRLLSAYTLVDGTVVWVITEADRSVTTILLPDEY